MENIIIKDNNSLRKYSKNFSKCKWINLKYLLQDKISYESSVKILKEKTIEQFASKCCDIYKKKIEINLLSEMNRELVSSFVNSSNKNSICETININIKKDIKSICSDSSFKDFLFYFRKNNDSMLEILRDIRYEQRQELIIFLCHYFYENFFNESTQQEEILYIIYLLFEEEIDKLNSPSILSFLEDSFLADFLIEIGNKLENKNYLDLILNGLI